MASPKNQIVTGMVDQQASVLGLYLHFSNNLVKLYPNSHPLAQDGSVLIFCIPSMQIK